MYSAALPEARGVTSHFSNTCFSFFLLLLFFFSGVYLTLYQATVFLSRGSAPFLQEQVANAKSTPCSKMAMHRFQTLIGVL